MIKLIFFGSDERAQIVLKSLKKNSQIKITQVIKDKDNLDQVLKLPQPDLGVVVSFGAKIPKKVIDFPKKGILNIHPSLLPQYRGTSPVQTAILNGDQQTGVTIIKINQFFDQGEIVAQRKEPIKPTDTTFSLQTRLFKLGAELVQAILPDYLAGKIKLRPQDQNQASYTKRLTRADGQINWQSPADYLERFIRAMFPWPGAWTQIKLKTQNAKGKIKRLKILKAHLEGNKLILDQVQLEGKNTVSWQQFQAGYPEAEIGG